MATNKHSNNFHGFDLPTTTPVPDQVFDVLMEDLTGAELKVLLYICRRTFGFKKDSDNISLNQLVSGIKTRDGKVLDRGTGLSKDSVSRVVKSLEEKNIIVRNRRQSEERGYEPTTYSLNITIPTKERPEEEGPTSTPNMDNPPLSENRTRHGGKIGQGLGRKIGEALVQKSDIQQTVIQQTVIQETEEQHDVVVIQALQNFGISKSAADNLTKNFPEELILEKLDLAQWLVSTGSPSVAKNPAGWLRKAIEEDYAPPRNYESPKQKKAKSEKDTQLAQREAKERQLVEAEYRRVKAEAKEQLLQEFPPKPVGEGLNTHTAWEQALQKLKDQVGVANYETWVKDTVLLEVTDRAAKIAAGSAFQVAWLERKLYPQIVNALKDVLKRQLDLQFITTSPDPE